jgi:kumamolisin
MAKRIKRVALSNSGRKLPKGSKLVGAADPRQQIEISVRIRARSAAPLDDDAIMAEAAKPASQRNYMSRQEFAVEEGADPADVAKIDDFAHAHGLNVKTVHLDSRTMKITGTVAALSAAFGVKLNKVKHEGATYRMRKGSVKIPQELEGIIVGVHGLDNRPVATPHFMLKPAARRGRGARAASAAASAAAQEGFEVAELAKLYNFPAGLTGAGQCIAIIELNDIDASGNVTGAGYDTADLETFFRKAGIPSPGITPVSVDGGANKPGLSDADTEVVLDIEVAAAAAPGARIVVYFAPNTTAGFIDAVKAAVHDTARKPSVISISWGMPENPQELKQFLDGLNEAIRDAAAMNITVCVASGDNGSASMRADWDGKAHANFPASSRFSLGCGGTNLQASNGQITAERVWNSGVGQGEGASGGGVSNVFPLPSYQQGVNVPKSPTNFTGRGVPDLAGAADRHTGYRIFLNGSDATVGGTSAVAPLMAGLVALINEATTKNFGKTVGLINPLIYQAGAKNVFRDITEGNNDLFGQLGLYDAAVGWDPCTGLGVADGTALLQLLNR